MSSAGVVLAVLGVWVIAQVTSGNALQRLGLIPPDEPSTAIGPLAGVTVPDRGYSGIPHDAQGRPL